MSKNNEQLVELIKDVVSGNKEKDVFCKEFYKEVYAIVYPVFGENSKKVTSRAFIYLCDNLDKIDVSRNVHRQIATLVSTFMFGLIDKKTIKYDAELSDYEFNRIKDDVELYNIIRDNVKMFKNPVDFERASDSIKELTRVQTIVLELYGYEMHSVEEIEELLDMDSAFIYGIIGQIKAQILGINISVSEDTDDAMEESGVDVYEEQEENDEYVPEDDNESEEEQPADSSNDEDEDEADSCSEEYIYMRKNARKKKGPDLVVEKLSELLGKLFPDLSHTARNIVVYVAGGVILLAIVISIFLSAILSGGANSANKKNSSGNTRVTIAETVTAHEKTTKAKKTKKTQADTEADNNATTKADTTKNNNNNNTDRKDVIEEATEESDDEGSDGGDEEEMEEEKEKPSEEEKEKPSEEDKEKPSEKETPSETQSDSNKTQETKSTEEKNTETSTETKATEENTKATKATEAVDNTTAAADINASNN